MKRKRKKTTRSLLSQVRSGAYRAPMGHAGPHRDRKNDYRRRKKVTEHSEKDRLDPFEP
jgi:hypothetical protein